MGSEGIIDGLPEAAVNGVAHGGYRRLRVNAQRRPQRGCRFEDRFVIGMVQVAFPRSPEQHRAV